MSGAPRSHSPYAIATAIVYALAFAGITVGVVIMGGGPLIGGYLVWFLVGCAHLFAYVLLSGHINGSNH